jgi:hypothetical protein
MEEVYNKLRALNTARFGGNNIKNKWLILSI